jgi:quinohemoprotein ethanol dehydrogenase
VLMQANKDGFYYVLDRLTGQFISAEPFAQVNWAKGIDPKTGRPIVNPEALYGTDSSIHIVPGPGGAHNWSPMSYNPSTGLVYIPTSTASSFNYAVEKDFNYKPGQQNMGIVFGFGRGGQAALKLPKAGTPPPTIGPAAQEGDRGGALIAWDPVTQKERWRRNGGGSIGGGTVTTAGNLVIQVVPDGRLIAYSADKGEKLLEVQTNLHGGMGPPVTYMVDGKQYISFMGGTGPLPRPPGGGGGGNNAAPAPAKTNEAHPGTAAATEEKAAEEPPPPGFGNGPQVTPKLLTFVLDGKAALPTPPAATPPSGGESR